VCEKRWRPEGTTDISVVGDLNGNTKTEIGIFKDGAWLLDHDGRGGWNAGNRNFGFGAAGWTPVIKKRS
jgi:hypothetical protein